MTSKRSFINTLKEDLKRRIWPLALSIVGFFFALPVLALIKVQDHLSSYEALRDTLPQLQYSFVRFTIGPESGFALSGLMIMAVLNAMHGMKYLHSKQEADFYGSIPVLRTSKFSAAYLNGILIAVIPYIVMQLFAAALGASNGLVTGAGFLYGVQTMFIYISAYILIYTFIVLAAVLTGHGAVTVAAAGVLMFGLEIYAAFLDGYGTTFFISKYSSYSDYTYLSPVTVLGKMIVSNETKYADPSQYRYPAQSFVIAAVFLILAAVLYALTRSLIKLRPAESAGRAMAFEASKPFIKVFIMIPTALAFGVFFPSISDSVTYGWLIFGLIVGIVLSHAVIEIIYEFDFKACVKHLPSAVIAAVIVALTACFFVLDPTGYDTKLPAEGSIESSALYIPGINSERYDYRYNYDGFTESEEERIMRDMRLTDTESVYTLAKAGTEFAKANRMRRNARDMEYDRVEPDGSNYTEISVNLRLRSGRQFRRTYYVDLNDSTNLNALKQIYDTDAYKNAEYYILSDAAKYGPYGTGGVENIQKISYESGSYETRDRSLSSSETEALIEAVKSETRSLTLDYLQEEAPIGYLYTETEIDHGNYRESYPMEIGYVYPSFEKTISLLNKYGIEAKAGLYPDDIDHIIKVQYDDDGEDISEQIESENEIKKLVPHLVKSDFSYQNYAIFNVVEDSNYEVYYRDSRIPSEIYVLKK